MSTCTKCFHGEVKKKQQKTEHYTESILPSSVTQVWPITLHSEWSVT